MSRKYTPSCISPPLHFEHKVLQRYLHPVHKLPPPSHRNSYTVRFKVSVMKRQRKKPASTEPLNLIASLFNPLGCLLNCLPRMQTACSNDEHANHFTKAPCFLVPQHWSSPTTSVGSISPPCASHSGPTPLPRWNFYTVRFKVSVVEWQRKNKASIHRTSQHFSIEGGHNRKRKCHILCISPPALCTKAKVAKGEPICGTLRYLTSTFCLHLFEQCQTRKRWVSYAVTNLNEIAS